MLRYSILFISIILTFQLSAQDQQKKHFVFDTDSVSTIKFDIIDPMEVQSWAGNQVMVTSEVKIYGANKGILEHFFEVVKRYEIVDTLQQNNLLIYSYVKNREVIKKGGETCYELIQVKIFMPEQFIQQEENVWILKEEENSDEKD